MKFVLFVIDTQSNSGNEDEMRAIDAFNAKLVQDGALLMAEGITAPENSLVIDNRSSVNLVSEGPLHNQKEYISGFWIIRANDLEQARAIALEASLACNRKVELRPLFGA